ncbi:sialin-like [Ptychodera flava]|uniref:sialin-like n=1 Tax=Ptychodera flava TaxID=63121 RepID=UPI00396A19D8
MGSSCRKCLDHIPARYVLALWMFLGMVNVYVLRNNISVAIVAMVNTTGEVADRYDDECTDGNTTVELVDQKGEFFWSSSLRGVLLGAYYYGYAVPQIIGGWMEKRIGGRVMFGTSVFLASLFAIVTPPAAYLDFWVLFTLRFLTGFVQGVVFPVHHGMWGMWAPPLERSELMSFSGSGTSVGSILVSAISGIIADTLGWPYIFYITGSFGIAWSICWVLIIHNTPDTHPRITEKEKLYIKSSIGPSSDETDKRTPWKAIWLSVPLWGLVIGHFCSNWGFYTLLTSLPIYIDQILGFDLSATGFIAALPNLGILVFTILSGWVADLLRRHKIMSTIAVRRMLTVFGMHFPAAFLVAAGFIGCNQALAIFLIVISAAFGACATPGFKVSHVEIAPRFAGILYGITNTVGSIPGFVSPYIVGVLTEDENTRERWLIVFVISAVIYVIGGTVVLFTLKTEEQDWAKEEKKIIDTSDVNKNVDDKGIDNTEAIELEEKVN